MVKRIRQGSYIQPPAG